MKGDQLYLRHILEALGKIEAYISVGRDVFMTTTHWQDAVIRQREIIGEATKRLSRICAPGSMGSPSVALRGCAMSDPQQSRS
jgi:uncharacterized protein with HEPN domain